jgi:hypothetical protein
MAAKALVPEVRHLRRHGLGRNEGPNKVRLDEECPTTPVNCWASCKWPVY